MRKEYDFSKGERGKFHHSDVADFMRELAVKKGTGVETIVNAWLRKTIDLVRSAD